MQLSDSQTFDQPLKKLGRLLNHAELQTYNQELTKNLNVDEFIKTSFETQGSYVGSAKLAWPDDDLKSLGLQLLLVQKFSESPDELIDFCHTFFYSNGKFSGHIQSFVTKLIIPFARDYKAYVVNQGTINLKVFPSNTKKVFVVHGHDAEARESVARYIEKLGLEAIILHEQANQGRTIIEKVEHSSDVGFAVVLLTPDDVGKSLLEQDLEPRARQNVLLELGYFIGRLQRSRVCALKKGKVSIPSDFAGVVWEELDEAGAWKTKLARELNAAGYKIDLSKLMI